MKSNSCDKCGSLNLVADRVLAGRIICANCGSPVLNYTVRKNTSIPNINRNIKNIIIFISVFMLVLILAI